MRFPRAEERLGIKEDFSEELTLVLNLKAQRNESGRGGQGENVRLKEKHVKKHQDIKQHRIIQRTVSADTSSITPLNQLCSCLS